MAVRSVDVLLFRWPAFFLWCHVGVGALDVGGCGLSTRLSATAATVQRGGLTLLMSLSATELFTGDVRGVATFSTLGGRAMIWGAYDSK